MGKPLKDDEENFSLLSQVWLVIFLDTIIKLIGMDSKYPKFAHEILG